MVLKKDLRQVRSVSTPGDLRTQRFAELEVAYRQQLRALRALLRTARGKQLKSRGDKV